MQNGKQMKRICSLIQKFCDKIVQSIKIAVPKLLYAKVHWLEKIKGVSYKSIIIFYFLFFCIGRIFLFSNPIRYDWIHQVVLTIISFIVIYSLRYAYDMTQEIRTASLGLIYKNRTAIYKSPTMYSIIGQMIDMQNSVWWLIIMLYPAIGFIKKNLYLGFVERNPAGYYAVFFGASTFYIALLGYSQILIALIYFGKISIDEGNCIPVDYPSDMIEPPKWLSLWNQLFQKITRLFFITGTLFTLEYTLLMPPNIVTIKDKHFIFNVHDVNKFISSWLTIFIWIIIAFPIISIAISYMQRLLVKNLSKKINHEHTLLFQRNMSNNSVFEVWIYKQLVEAPIKYNNYFQTYKKIIPVASTIISLLLNIAKLYESIIPKLL